MKKTLGGDRLGSGNKQKVHLHGYERSTHDLGNLWRSTMSAGTLVPFMKLVALPGDTFDINLNCEINTHPTTGPLFGSFKVQLDIFTCPVRLYQAQLHNNKLKIGMNMSAVKLPQLQLEVQPLVEPITDLDNAQINPSCILKYLGISGIGVTPDTQVRLFNAIPFLAYWDIYKNYYANKQEEIGAVIHTTQPPLVETVTEILIAGLTLDQAPSVTPQILTGSLPIQIEIVYTGTPPNNTDIIFNTDQGERLLSDLVATITDTGTQLEGFWYPYIGTYQLFNWKYKTPNDITTAQPEVATFPLDNLDDMRELILADVASATPFLVTGTSPTPYSWVLQEVNDFPARLNTQEGLAIKTYQSDLFNNWLNTEWIDGTGGISEVTAIDTSGGSFTIDQLALSEKVWQMLNRIAVSGGSYNDWIEVQYDHQLYVRSEIPMYMGGLSKELVFQEVVSNSEATGTTGEQPLGTLAGKGTLAKKHKGGRVTIKCNEISYIIGIISLTPRIDYSQGNEWDTHLLTMDDFHKPALDEIGFQELIQEQMAWWTTVNIADVWTTKSAGKQPAWINYMTAYNQTFGNFAITGNEMFMTLNRRYEGEDSDILDLTTYIDPVKYNQIFAQTSLDAQNFWVQISKDVTSRRKMSARIIPNL